MFSNQDLSTESNSSNGSSPAPLSVSSSLVSEPESKSTPVSEAERLYLKLKESIKKDVADIHRRVNIEQKVKVPDKSAYATDYAKFKIARKSVPRPVMEEQKGSEKILNAIRTTQQKVQAAYKELAEDIKSQDLTVSDLFVALKHIPNMHSRNDIATAHANKITTYSELDNVLRSLNYNHHLAFIKLHLDKIKDFPQLINLVRFLPKRDKLELVKLNSNLITSFKEVDQAILHLSSKNRTLFVELHKDKFTTFEEVNITAHRLSPKVSKQFFETHLDKVKAPEHYRTLFDYYLSSIELNEFFSTHRVKITLTTTSDLLGQLRVLLIHDLSRDHYIQFLKQHLAVVTTFQNLDNLLRYVPQDIKSEIVTVIAPQLRPTYNPEEMYRFFDWNEIDKLPPNDQLSLRDTYIDTNGLNGLIDMLSGYNETDKFLCIKRYHQKLNTLDDIRVILDQLYYVGPRLDFTSLMLDKIESLKPNTNDILIFMESLSVTKLSYTESLSMTSFKKWLQTQIQTYSNLDDDTSLSAEDEHKNMQESSSSFPSSYNILTKPDDARATPRDPSPFIRSITSGLGLAPLTQSIAATPEDPDQNVSTRSQSPSSSQQ